jgi:hypothetical protein
MAMLKLIILLALAQTVPQPEANIKLRDRLQGPTPVTDKDLRPVKAPDCKTEAEIQKTLEQLSYGEPGDCFIRDKSRLTKS